jgi:23S rRNA (uridine2552-2'-O)-methyltransferase
MTRWYKDKKREHFYKKAKNQGYRARSAYKLKQIQRKFHVIRKGDKVVDLGAAPGGWSQVAKEIVGEEGLVVGIDLSYVKPLEDVVFLKGDMTEKDSLDRVVEVVGDSKVDVVLSDMSPDITGNYSMDQARSVYLCEKALDASKVILKPGGFFVCKIFEGEDLKSFVKKVKSCFSSVRRFNPPASRKSSSEVYIVAKGFEG